MSRGNWNILWVSTFVYLFIAPFFFQPDLKVIYYLSQFFSHGVIDIYKFLGENPEKSFLGPFVYLPLSYFTFGVLFIPVKLLAGSNFVDWLGMGNDAVSIPQIFRYIFLMKFPLIVVHLATGWLLTKVLTEARLKTVILFVWFFNPISLYVVGMMGQLDGIPTLLTVLAFLLAGRNPYLSALLLGFGASFKSYPLLMLPFLSVVATNTWRKSVGVFFVGIIPFVLTIFPFLATPEFYRDALASGLALRIFEARIQIGFNEQILVLPAIFVLLFLHAVVFARGQTSRLLGYFLALPFLIIAGTHFHPQWTLWALPFFSLAIVYYRLWLPLVFFLVGWFGTVFLFDDKFLTLGLLSPLDPGILFLPTIRSLLFQSTDPPLMQSVFHTILAATIVWVVWEVFRRNKNE